MDSDMEISSGSEDGDAYVADLLQQFANPDEDDPVPFQNGLSNSDTNDRDDSNSQDKPDAGVRFFIEVPVKDVSDYELIPVHSTVDEIIHQSNGTTREPFYYVQMLSGEKKTVRLHC